MKKIIILCAMITNQLLCQNYCVTEGPTTDGTLAPCCNGNINTDYNFPFNPERLDLVNQFNWLQFPSGALQSYIKIGRNNAVIPIEHPFLNDVSIYSWYSNYSIGDPAPFLNHNMHPKYGWQLLHYNLGLNLFSNTAASNVPQRFNPYMIFYNKHTGKIRLFTSPGEGNSFDSSAVQVSMVTGVRNSILYSASGLFSHNMSLITALDQPTEINTISASLPFASPNKWTGTDIQTTYDPCLCKNQSRLNFNFFDQDFSKVYMSGNIVGIISPLDKSGNSPLQFGEDYISSVYTNYKYLNKNSPTNGMIVYNKIDQIVANARVTSNMKDLSNLIGMLSGMTSGFNIDSIPFVIGGPITWPIGSLIGKGLSFFSQQINPPAPQISFLEATGAFSGEVNNVSNSGGYGAFELLTPGSNHEYRQQVPWTQQPLYNEALGLFALLSTPKVYYTDLNIGTHVPSPYFNATNGIGFTIEGPINFAVNPAADIDMDKSTFYAAIEFDLHDTYGLPTYVKDFTNNQIEAKTYFEPTFKQISTDDETETIFNPLSQQVVTLPSDKRTFTTYIMPINKIDKVSYVSKFWEGTFQPFTTNNGLYSPNCRLRIYANYVFKPNQYGEVNRTVQSYSYKMNSQYLGYNNLSDFPCNPINYQYNNQFCNKPIIGDFLQDIEINTNTNYTTSQNIYGNNIKINANLSTSPGIIVKIYYRSSVEINPNSTISSNIIFEKNDFEDYTPIELPDESYMKNVYCKSKYKANTVKYAPASPPSFSNLERMSMISLHPNPSKTSTMLTLLGFKGATATISVHDMMGKMLYSQVLKNIDDDRTEVPISTASYADGVYILKVNDGKEDYNQKLVVQQ